MKCTALNFKGKEFIIKLQGAVCFDSFTVCGDNAQSHCLAWPFQGAEESQIQFETEPLVNSIASEVNSLRAVSHAPFIGGSLCVSNGLE